MTERRADPARRKEFLERSVYRRRRLVDAVKLLPALGAGLFLFPAAIVGEDGGSTAQRLVYFFVAWCLLIGICALLVRGFDDDAEG